MAWSWGDQRQYDILRSPAVVANLEQLAESAPQTAPLERSDRQVPRPWLEASAAGVGSSLELRFLRLFKQHGFQPEKQVPVSPRDGLPPISITDFAVPARRLAIYASVCWPSAL